MYLTGSALTRYNLTRGVRALHAKRLANNSRVGNAPFLYEALDRVMVKIESRVIVTEQRSLRGTERIAINGTRLRSTD